MRTTWRNGIFGLGVVVAGVCSATVPLVAQRPARGLVEVPDGTRRGFWAGLGFGAGGESFDVGDGLGYSEPLYRPTVSIRLGGTVTPSLRLGGEALVWTHKRDDVLESLSSFLFVGQFYPSRRAGVYLKGGVGFGRNAVEIDDADVSETGFAGLLGMGYELPLSRRVALVPSVDLVQHWYSERGTEGYRERLLNFGIGIVYQPGR